MTSFGRGDPETVWTPGGYTVRCSIHERDWPFNERREEDIIILMQIRSTVNDDDFLFVVSVNRIRHKDICKWNSQN